MGEKAKGNLVKVLKPKFISLVDRPANESPIKIVRSAPQTGEITMTKPGAKRITRSEQPNSVLKITFPSTMTDEEVTAALATYGMKDFAVAREGETVTATRSDLQSIAKDTPTLDIKLGDGITATVKRAAEVETTSGKAHIAITAFEFDAEKFDVLAISEWIARNSVDNASDPAENSASSFVVTRSEVEDGAETKRLQIEEGVVAIIVRSDCYDVPDGMAAVINEACYGNWGWGHLDFAAALADVEFCEWMETAMYSLRDVLNRIIFYSQLPLATRKELVNTALSQYGAFVSSVIDSLPRQMMISVVRSAQPKEISMSTKETQASGAATTVATPAVAAVVAAPAAAAPAAVAQPATGEDKPIMRSELKGLLREVLAETEADKAKAAADALEAAKNQPITRADLEKAVVDATKPLQDELAALKGTTVIRSDTGDAAVTTVAQPAKPAAADEKKDVFRGAFGKVPFANAQKMI